VGRIGARNPYQGGVLPTGSLNHAARNAGGRIRALIAAAIGVCALAALAAAVWPSSATSGQRPLRVLVMGKTSDGMTPTCPDACTVEGRFTGFQSLTSDGGVRPFQAPYDGKVISWSISLGNPKREDRAFFVRLFDRPAQARIGIIKRVGDSPPVYKLVRQSPIQILTPYFGETVHFALDHPLTVLKDQVVALTIPTWAPMFRRELPLDDTWRGSREKGRCNYPDLSMGIERLRAYAQHNYPQQKPQSTKQYGCYFRGSRLFYTATVVKKPRG
jgi:hypothetical protein